MIAPDGLALYFNSNRTGGLGGNDIWVTRRASLAGAWEAPRNLGSVINSTVADLVPAMSPDSRQLFVTTLRAGGIGDYDIWMATRTNVSDDLSWGALTNLGTVINTATADAAPYLLTVGAQTTFYFGRGPVIQNMDFFISTVTNGVFGAPAGVSELTSINTTDAHPTIRRDGREIIFYSARAGATGGSDLWTSTRSSATAAWAAPVPITALNTLSEELHPSLSRDGTTLFFVSDRTGGLGGNDLYMVTRQRLNWFCPA
jgi:hypothetical protein